MSLNLATWRAVVDQARQKVGGHASDRISSKQQQEEEFFRRELQLAKETWQYAENHFREATDQDLIDQATYDILSAKTRYTYLLKQARQKGLHL